MATDSSFEQLLRINQATFDEGDYETACHSLMAAMDRARYVGLLQALRTVGQLADEQLTALKAVELPARFPNEQHVRKQSLSSLYRSIIQQSVSWEQLVLHWRAHHTPTAASAPKEEADSEAPSRPLEG